MVPTYICTTETLNQILFPKLMNLSIVIPTLNEANNLEKLIPYLQSAQKGNDIEIIVADAIHSTDQSFELANKLGAKAIKCPTSSRAVQMNLGAQKAQGNVLYFIHADVIPPKSFYSDILETMEKGFSIGLFSYQFDSPKKLLCVNSYVTKFDGIFAGGGDQTIFVKREVFLELNGFCESYCIMEDFDFIRRVKKAKIPYHIIQKNVTVSARKYAKNSYCRVTFANLLVFSMFKLGFSPTQLKKVYRSLLKS